MADPTVQIEFFDMSKETLIGNSPERRQRLPDTHARAEAGFSRSRNCSSRKNSPYTLGVPALPPLPPALPSFSTKPLRIRVPRPNLVSVDLSKALEQPLMCVDAPRTTDRGHIEIQDAQYLIASYGRE